jgi:hypothetical protein
MALKDFKEGDLVIYNNKVYFFDCYEEDYKVRILLLEDDSHLSGCEPTKVDDIDMFNILAEPNKSLKAYTVKLKYVDKYNK